MRATMGAAKRQQLLHLITGSSLVCFSIQHHDQVRSTVRQYHELCIIACLKDNA
jgi:hypothetical protein